MWSHQQVVAFWIDPFLVLNTVFKIFGPQILYLFPLFMFFLQLLTRSFTNNGYAVIFEMIYYFTAQHFGLMSKLVYPPLFETFNEDFHSREMFQTNVFRKFFFLSDLVLFFGLALGLKPLWRKIREIRNILFAELNDLVSPWR